MHKHFSVLLTNPELSPINGNGQGQHGYPCMMSKKIGREDNLVQVQASLMQPHALFEPMLAFDLTQVGASKARCLALTSKN